ARQAVLSPAPGRRRTWAIANQGPLRNRTESPVRPRHSTYDRSRSDPNEPIDRAVRQSIGPARCRYATEVCAVEQPRLVPYGSTGHVAACHHPLNVDRETLART